MATKESFGHLFIDLDPKTSDCLRYCSNITEPAPKVFYLPCDEAETTPLNNDKEEKSILKQIVQLQPKQLRKYMRGCDSDVILVICECLNNVSLRHVRVNVRVLENYRQTFERVLTKNSSTDKRRTLLQTKTGFELTQLIIKFCFIQLS